MGDIKERRNGQKDETEAKRRNKRRCEKSRPAIARRLEGGIKRGKSVSFETRGFRLVARRRIARRGSRFFVSSIETRSEEEEDVKDWPRRVHCYGTGPIAGRVRGRPRTWDCYGKKKNPRSGSQFLTHLMSDDTQINSNGCDAKCE